MKKPLFALVAIVAAFPSSAGAEVPNPTATSCAAGNPKQCIKEADEMFSAGAQGRSQAIVQLLTRACELDEPDGCRILAGAFKADAFHVGNPKNLHEAERWFGRWRTVMESACDKTDVEHAQRCSRIAGDYAEGKGDIWNGVPVAIVPKDGTKATTLYAKLAPTQVTLCNGGDAPSCLAAGAAYQNALGVTADPTKAKGFFVSACKGKQPDGCLQAGMIDEACALGSSGGCDQLCQAGNDKACDGAAPSVRAAVRRRTAQANLPALFTKCAAAKTQMETLRVARVKAGANRVEFARADSRLKDAEPAWRTALADLRRAVELATDPGSGERMKAEDDVEVKCSCRVDPDRPGSCLVSTSTIRTRPPSTP